MYKSGGDGSRDMKSNIKIVLDTKKLDKLIVDVPARKKEVLDKTAFDITAYAQVASPILMGVLRNSIHWFEMGENARVISDGVLYGIIREYGIRGPAQPFMTPAVEAHRGNFYAALRSIARV